MTLEVPLGQRMADGVLVGEVLVERADTDAGAPRDVVGGQPRVAALFQQPHGRGKDGLDRVLRAVLGRGLEGFQSVGRAGSHGNASSGRSAVSITSNTSKSSH